jgi:hypothetical protein
MYVHLDGSLRKAHHEINLPDAPFLNKSKAHEKSNREPTNDWAPCLEIVHTIGLLSAMKVKASFSLDDL